MKHFGTVEQGCPVSKLRLHPRRPLLASVAGLRPEVCIWGWDESGAMECLARIERTIETTTIRGTGRHPLDELMASRCRAIEDVAWHPHDDQLAVVGGGSAVELWARGSLLKTLESIRRRAGKSPSAGRAISPSPSPRAATGSSPADSARIPPRSTMSPRVP